MSESQKSAIYTITRTAASEHFLCTSLHLQEEKSSHTQHVSGVLPYICRMKKFLYLNCFCMFLVYFFTPAGGEKSLHLQEGKSLCTCRRGKVSVPVITYLDCFCMFLVYFFTPAGGEKSLHLQEGKSLYTCRRGKVFAPAGGEKFLYQSPLTWTASACFWCTSLHLQEGNSFCTSHHLPGLLLHVSGVLLYTCRRGTVSVPVITYLDCFCMFLVYFFTPAGGEQFLYQSSLTWTASACFWCTSSHLQEGKSFCTSHHLPGLLLHVSGVPLYTCRRGTVSVPVITYLDCFCMFLYQSSLTWTASARFCTSHHLPGLLLHVSVPVITYLDCFCMFLVYFFTPAGGEQFLYQSTLTWTASACFWFTSSHLQEGKSFCTSHHLPGLLLHVSGVPLYTCRRGTVSVPVITYLDCFCMFLYQSSLTWTASACFWCTSLHLQEGKSFCTSHHLPGLLLHVSGVLLYTCRRGKVSVPVSSMSCSPQY